MYIFPLRCQCLLIFLIICQKFTVNSDYLKKVYGCYLNSLQLFICLLTLVGGILKLFLQMVHLSISLILIYCNATVTMMSVVLGLLLQAVGVFSYFPLY